jgi:spermidine synthase
LAAYAKPGQFWTFFEIDPAVVAIARDDNYFTFLKDSPAITEIIVGDGRLSLQRSLSERFDILVVDAFSSDVIPVHLATFEALSLYAKRLSPHGTLLFHISNLHLDLEPVLTRVAEEADSTA